MSRQPWLDGLASKPERCAISWTSRDVLASVEAGGFIRAEGVETGFHVGGGCTKREPAADAEAARKMVAQGATGTREGR